jgi:hypothetical protein
MTRGAWLWIPHASLNSLRWQCLPERAESQFSGERVMPLFEVQIRDKPEPDSKLVKNTKLQLRPPATRGSNSHELPSHTRDTGMR